MMKRFLMTSALLCSLLFSGCKDELDEKYYNPKNQQPLVYQACLPEFWTITGLDLHTGMFVLFY